MPDLAAVRREFDYVVPEPLMGEARVGSRVRVPLHGRRVAGWIVETDVTPAADLELRRVEGFRGFGPPPRVVELAKWAAWRWAGPVSTFLSAGSPPRIVKSLPPLPPMQPRSSRAGGDPSVGGCFGGGTVVVRRPPGEDTYSIACEAGSLLDRPEGLETSVLDPGAEASEREGPGGVLLLTPVHEDATALVNRLRADRHRVALLPDDWAMARAGGCVVVGARNAAFAPLPRLRAAVVFDAHDESYYEERAPTWCAWRVVVERSRRDGAPCVLVSPCPTLDVVEAGPLLVPSRREERNGWPALEVVDRRADDPRTGLFSERVVSLVRWGGSGPRRRVLCVVNQTGRARLVVCASCGEIARCESCGGALELLKDEGGESLGCRLCGSARPVLCARCGAGRMKALRPGVSRIREELEALSGTRVAEVWGRPGPKKAQGATHAASAVAAGQASVAGARASVVVGTEALLRRTAAADAVVFLDFDSELLAPRLRASEEALALLALASRRVAGSTELRPDAGSVRSSDLQSRTHHQSEAANPEGRGTRPGGRVVVQTRMPSHDVLVSASLADPGRLLNSEREQRIALGLPPYGAIATLSGAVADDYARALAEAGRPDVELSGPNDGTWWLRAARHDALCDLLDAVKRPRGRLRVEVEPVRV
jgi:primosomal protein N' (replication factor Y)